MLRLYTLIKKKKKKGFLIISPPQLKGIYITGYLDSFTLT